MMTEMKPVDNAALYRTAAGYEDVLAHYAASLDKLTISYEESFVDTTYGLTHAVICGNEKGKPVVLWHGLNANSTTWFNWFPSLAPAYRIYAVDTLGGMGQSAPTRPSKKGLDYGHWAAEALKGLGLNQANMIGASNGGWLVLKLANVAVEMISCAILMSSAGFLPASLSLAVRMVPRIAFKRPDEAARKLLALLSPSDLLEDPFFLDFLELMIRSGFRAEQNPPALADSEISQLTAPTFLLMGQYEITFDPYKAIRRGLKLLPHLTRAEIVPNVGHSMVHRNPDWVSRRLVDFLDEYAV